MQDVHAQGGARQPHQAQLQALAGVAVQGVGVGRALQKREPNAAVKGLEQALQALAGGVGVGRALQWGGRQT